MSNAEGASAAPAAGRARVPIARRTVDAALGCLLFVLGVALCLHYGRMGFMPLDQSIAWDAGWRILGGQVPFRDFVTTTSLVPGALQAAVFAVAGVSWLAYCAHAAVANGVFAAGVFALLRGEGLHPALAAGFGAASAVFFYPPFGVPYGDQHSFLFGLLALLVASAAGRASSRCSLLLFALVPVLLLLGYLSKPVPVGFLVPAVAVAALWPAADRLRPRVLALLAGALVSVAAVVVALASAGADLALAWDYLVTMPLESGGRRALYPGWLGDRVRALLQLGGRSGMVFPAAAAAASAVALAGVAALAVGGRDAGEGKSAPVRPLVTALLLWAATALFVGVTRNQARNGHALLPVVLGLLASSLALVARAAAARRGGRSPVISGLKDLAAWGSVALALVALHDAVRFNATVNATRMVHDAGYDPRRAAAARGALPPALDFLEWGLASTRYSPRDLTALVDAVAAQPAPVLLVSDSLVVYALAGKPSVNPNLWYHPGVSMPRPDDRPRIERLDALFIERLEDASPGLVVFDPPPGPRFRLEMLPRTSSWLRARRCAAFAIGPFPSWRLCPDGATLADSP